MKNKLKPSLLVIGAILFNLIFWNQQIGLNLLLFSLFLASSILLVHRNEKKSKAFYFTLASVIITGIFVSYHNSSTAKFSNVISIILMIGFLNQSKIHSLSHAFITSLINYLNVVKNLKSDVPTLGIKTTNMGIVKRNLKPAIMPAGILIVFVIIFQIANPIFSELLNDILNSINVFFEYIFEHISFARICFFFFGASIVTWGIYKSNFSFYAAKEQSLSDSIYRKKTQIITSSRTGSNVNSTKSKEVKSILGLKNEYRSAILLLISVNLLLLIVNVIDVNWIWFNFTYSPSELSSFVHEGTYLLILSTLLSMGILLYYFRANQNFYYKRPTLVLFATLWIVQNVVLVISVAIRNYHYIQYYQLTHKRIGVIIFLLITIGGLVILYNKINKRKSFYYFTKSCSWIVYISFILMSCFNWDGIIVNYNLNRSDKSNIDVAYLISLSDKTLPLIDQNTEALSMHIDSFRDHHNWQVESFISRMEKQNWYSWNYLDYQAYRYYKVNITESKNTNDK